jgi:aspartokinase-like uncharacterized kinase
MIVVKVGGSLYDHPGLGPGLWAYLESLAAPALLVPGGGPFADAVRSLDAIHGLGDESAHWLALRSLDTAAAFLRRLLGPILSHPVTEPPPHGDHPWQHLVLDARTFCFHDAELPHSWAVTSDSIAARAAVAFGAARLVLLKSADIPPGTPWPEAAARGWVDAHFPSLVAKHGLRVEAVNFRRWLDEHVPATA